MRKSQMELSDVIFWVLSSAGLVILSVFPRIATFFAELLGIYSDLNFIYISIIFIILLKLFSLSIEVSKLKVKLRNLIQEYAIRDNEKINDKRM